MPVSDDAFLGGRLRILQPRQGYRAGLDAVMLAAAVGDREGAPFSVLDAGAGVGTAGLCVAWRCPAARVVLVEREPELVALARENIARNALGDRVTIVEADVSHVTRAELSALDVAEGAFDQVIANPPYHAEGAGTAAPHALKAAAYAMPLAGLDPWCRFLARMARPGGEALIIHKTAALPHLMQVLTGRFGGLTALPLHSFAGEPAGRILLRGVKGSRAPFRLEAGIWLHDAENRFTPGAEGVLRLGQSLAVAYGLSGTEGDAQTPALQSPSAPDTSSQGGGE
ncbi:methyltransferase [Hyphomicrobium sp.]|uniref:tRNA1(Val) (adenine(37)-N6)-methyltransferase n=1 Tax=Hyphomicrobium sp. TaxID=82 RepID=UPI0025BBF026|nr:methyltransferase [Hyphomicrobium sp.]MCC7250648.1 methyltransferase [Hyphomicrobium sp.]